MHKEIALLFMCLTCTSLYCKPRICFSTGFASLWGGQPAFHCWELHCPQKPHGDTWGSAWSCTWFLKTQNLTKLLMGFPILVSQVLVWELYFTQRAGVSKLSCLFHARYVPLGCTLKNNCVGFFSPLWEEAVVFEWMKQHFLAGFLAIEFFPHLEVSLSAVLALNASTHKNMLLQGARLGGHRMC